MDLVRYLESQAPRNTPVVELLKCIRTLAYNYKQVGELSVSVAGLKYYKEKSARAIKKLREVSMGSLNMTGEVKFVELVKRATDEVSCSDEREEAAIMLEKLVKQTKYGNVTLNDCTLQNFYEEHFLSFKRNPNNTHDSNAIEVWFHGHQIGHIPRWEAMTMVKNHATEDIEGSVGILYVASDDTCYFDMFMPYAKEEALEDDYTCDDVEDEEDLYDKWDDKEVKKKKKQDSYLDDEAFSEYCEKVTDRISKMPESFYPKAQVGLAGPMGPKGDTGMQGIPGAQGPMGPSGTDGITAIRFVGANGPASPMIGDLRIRQLEAEVFDGSKWVHMGQIHHNPIDYTVRTEVGDLAMYSASFFECEPSTYVRQGGQWTKCEEPTQPAYDYRDYTGFLRTILEYATFAHR